MALAHAILVAHNCIEIVQGAASCYTVGDAQTNHDNQLRRHNDPFAQFRPCINTNRSEGMCHLVHMWTVFLTMKINTNLSYHSQPFAFSGRLTALNNTALSNTMHTSTCSLKRMSVNDLQQQAG